MKLADKKHLAQSLYVKSELSRKAIAEQVNITEKTLRKWIELGEWDKMKDAMQITRPQLLQEAYAQLQAINQIIREEHNNVPPKDLSDAKGVIRKEIEAFSSNPIHRYIECFEDFIDYLSKNQPGQLRTFASLSMEFINELQRRNS